jgi:hypothetical protein
MGVLSSPSDNKGRYPALQDYTKRKVDGLLWADDMDTSEVVAWRTFRTIWKEDYPKIRIRPPCNDMCGECTIFKNAFHYKQHQPQHRKASDSDIDEEVEDEEDLEVVDITR